MRPARAQHLPCRSHGALVAQRPHARGVAAGTGRARDCGSAAAGAGKRQQCLAGWRPARLRAVFREPRHRHHRAPCRPRHRACRRRRELACAGAVFAATGALRSGKSGLDPGHCRRLSNPEHRCVRRAGGRLHPRGGSLRSASPAVRAAGCGRLRARLSRQRVQAAARTLFDRGSGIQSATAVRIAAGLRWHPRGTGKHGRRIGTCGRRGAGGDQYPPA